MKLYIDTSDSKEIMIKVDDVEYKTSSVEEKSQKLLPFIIEVLDKKSMTVDDIKEIEVNTGPGSFTGIRIGMSVAGALGWALDIPVNGKNIKDGTMPDINY